MKWVIFLVIGGTNQLLEVGPQFSNVEDCVKQTMIIKTDWLHGLQSVSRDTSRTVAEAEAEMIKKYPLLKAKKPEEWIFFRSDPSLQGSETQDFQRDLEDHLNLKQAQKFFAGNSKAFTGSTLACFPQDR